jgi:type IV secretion system protein TrbB
MDNKLKTAAPNTKEDRVLQKLERDMGPLLIEALNDPRTVEIMVNADGKIWQEKLGEPMKYIGELSFVRAENIIKTVAGFHELEVTNKSPILESTFPLDGSRFAGQLPPVVRAPTFAIRKKAVSVFSMTDYVDANIMTIDQFYILLQAIENHKNILIVGGTGSGKTTLVNGIINEMVLVNPNERVVIIEDTGEIQCSAKNYIQYHTSATVSMTLLLKATLRMRPDRILVGEVRDAAALDLLMAWNTGHEGGAATLHANSAKAGLDRLAMLISMNPESPKPIEPFIAEVVHMVVHISRTQEGGRKIMGIIEVNGYKNGHYITSDCQFYDTKNSI